MSEFSYMLCLNFILGFLLCSSTCWAAPNENKIRNVRSLMVDYKWPVFASDLKRYPHQISCSHFYDLERDGEYNLVECPHGQIFDYVTLTCARKTLALCWSSQLDHDYKPRKLRKPFKCPFAWGKYPDIHDCSKFFLCLNGKAHHKKCPPSKRFDKIERKCVLIRSAICADDSDVVDPKYRCPYVWGHFTYPKDCSKYYECLMKKPSLNTCREGMLFDSEVRKCLPKEKVDCGKRYNPYDQKSTTEVIEFTSTITTDTDVTTEFTVTAKTEATTETGVTDTDAITETDITTGTGARTIETDVTSTDVATETDVTTYTDVTTVTDVTTNTVVTTETGVTANISVTAETGTSTEVTTETRVITDTDVTTETGISTDTDLRTETGVTADTSATAETGTDTDATAKSDRITDSEATTETRVITDADATTDTDITVATDEITGSDKTITEIISNSDITTKAVVTGISINITDTDIIPKKQITLSSNEYIEQST